MTAASVPTSVVPMPRLNSAVSSGRPAASSEPNVSSRTRAAIAKPTTSGLTSLSWALEIAQPDIATRRPSLDACWASAMSSSPVCLGTSPGRVASICRRAIAVVPSRETSGGSARPMPSSFCASAINPSMRSRMSGERAPASACQTTSIVAAERSPKRSLEDLLGGGGVRAGRVEVGVVVAGERGDEDERRGERGDPGDEHGPAPAVAPGSEAGEAGGRHVETPWERGRGGRPQPRRAAVALP